MRYVLILGALALAACGGASDEPAEKQMDDAMQAVEDSVSDAAEAAGEMAEEAAEKAGNIAEEVAEDVEDAVKGAMEKAEDVEECGVALQEPVPPVHRALLCGGRPGATTAPRPCARRCSATAASYCGPDEDR